MICYECNKDTVILRTCQDYIYDCEHYQEKIYECNRCGAIYTVSVKVDDTPNFEQLRLPKI